MTNQNLYQYPAVGVCMSTLLTNLDGDLDANRGVKGERRFLACTRKQAGRRTGKKRPALDWNRDWALVSGSRDSTSAAASNFCLTQDRLLSHFPRNNQQHLRLDRSADATGMARRRGQNRETQQQRRQRMDDGEMNVTRERNVPAYRPTVTMLGVMQQAPRITAALYHPILSQRISA